MIQIDMAIDRFPFFFDGEKAYFLFHRPSATTIQKLMNSRFVRDVEAEAKQAVSLIATVKNEALKSVNEAGANPKFKKLYDNLKEQFKDDPAGWKEISKHITPTPFGEYTQRINQIVMTTAEALAREKDNRTPLVKEVEVELFSQFFDAHIYDIIDLEMIHPIEPGTKYKLDKTLFDQMGAEKKQIEAHTNFELISWYDVIPKAVKHQVILDAYITDTEGGRQWMRRFLEYSGIKYALISQAVTKNLELGKAGKKKITYDLTPIQKDTSRENHPKS